MTVNLRLSLTVLSIGFGIEGGGELYSYLSQGRFQPGVNLLFIVPAIATVLGLLFVWVGRHEWNELHHARVKGAHLIFAASLLAGGVGAAIVGLLVAYPGLGVPDGAKVAFGAAVGSLVLGTFITYVVLVFHLVPGATRVVLLASVAWAFLIAALISAAMASNLSTMVGLVVNRTFTVPGFLAPVDSLASLLFVSYFLLLASYVDAHRTVARGPATEPAIASITPGPP